MGGPGAGGNRGRGWKFRDGRTLEDTVQFRRFAMAALLLQDCCEARTQHGSQARRIAWIHTSSLGFIPDNEPTTVTRMQNESERGTNGAPTA